jgi:hypothetical protein
MINTKNPRGGRIGWVAFLLAMLISAHCHAQANDAGLTSFQIGAPWSSARDLAADTAIVYGINENFEQRIASWRDQGYRVEFMTGAAWGNYSDYVEGRFDNANHMDDAQVRRDGTRVMHDGSTPYFVPSPTYVAYLKTQLKRAIDGGAGAIYMEEPEFWAFAGYSEGFKRAFAAHYGRDWEPPHASVDARYDCDRLKYQMYHDALDQLFKYAKDYAASKHQTVQCYVPTHDLITYSQIKMVSPMSSLMSLPNVDGYIAQVWTGTARAPNQYRGVLTERTFEMGYFEYAQMVSMVRPTGKTCILLCDPMEDDPNHGWDDYEANYKRTLVASLMQPEAMHYEICPWPNRVFEQKYFATEAQAQRRNANPPPPRVPISPKYASVLLTCFNALADMDPRGHVKWDSGFSRIGVLVSDTMMFQRDDPTPSDPHLASFFGLAMPLLKDGLPAKVVQLETIKDVSALKDVDVLLMTYEGMKPPTPEFHAILSKWVRETGGVVIYVDDQKDPYNAITSWWTPEHPPEAGALPVTPGSKLLEAFGITKPQAINPCGKGFVIYSPSSPAALAHDPNGADLIMKLVTDALKAIGKSDQLHSQSHLILHRGNYVVAAVMNESISNEPVILRGRFVNLFNAQLPIEVDPSLSPGSVGLYYDIDTATAPKVLAASSRIRKERSGGRWFQFESRGPIDTACTMRVLLPAQPSVVTASTAHSAVQADWAWDEGSKTLLVHHTNRAEAVQFQIQW